MSLAQSGPAVRQALAGIFCLLVWARAEAQPSTVRVSVGSGGVQANHSSRGPAISADGRWVAFDSSASNLVPGDTNNAGDVFLHDRQTGTTVRVSISTGGLQGDRVSHSPSMSADGRWIAFSSAASTLFPGDTNSVLDVFLHDRVGGTTTCVSLGPLGVQGNSESDGPEISADGRWVAFDSIATNLIEGDTNGESDVFVYDRQTGTTTRVSVGSGGIEANAGSLMPAISADGRVIAFQSLASNLVSGDTNGMADTFVHDRQTGITTRVNVGPGGVEANGWSFWQPAISADGSRVAFQSAASNLVPSDLNAADDVFVHDRGAGITVLASLGPGEVTGDRRSEYPALSADGRWVVFNSPSTNLVAGDTNNVDDVFAHDLLARATTRVSVAPGGADGNMGSSSQAVSANGRWIAFASAASNLVAVDTNGSDDVFVHDFAATEPLPPLDLTVESVSENLVTLRWTTASFGAAPMDFVIEGGTMPGQVLASYLTGSTRPTFVLAAPDGSFYVRVHALRGVARSAASNEVRVHVNVFIPPSAPANLLGLVNGSTVALTWVNTYAGGAPTSLSLDVSGTITTSLPLGFGDTVTMTNVPPGTYTLSLRATNAAGSSPASNAVTLTFPGPCSGPPAAPSGVHAYQLDRTAVVSWTPGASGPAPTAYVLIVTGSVTESVVTTSRLLSGAVGPGAYTLSLVAVNPCGASAATSPVVLIVP